MKKKEIIFMVVFAIISLLYRFQMPKETVNSIVQEVEISVYIEGKINRVITFQETPTMKKVFQELAIENIYQFDESYVLHDKQVLYLPENDNYQELISLNTATAEELMEISGVGPKTAENIINYRNESPFKVIEDIMNIKGIGEKTYYQIRSYVCL
jgi:comEA protein